jgi:pimeloyl-ACP methyl ester carboxylesterase
MPLTSLNGIAFYYESTGTGETVTFLHGAGGNHLSWWQQVPHFRHKYRCLTLDHRGFGRSTDPQAEGVARFADDLEALLDELGIGRTALVAQSMGGRTASEFLLRHPQRASAVVMCDTLGILAWEDLRERREKRRAARLATAGESGVLSRGYMALGFIERQPAMTFLYQQLQGLNPPRGETGLPLTTSQEELAKISVPMLFIVGSEDPVLPADIVGEVVAAIPGAEFLEFSACGHSVYWENAHAFNRALDTFLAKHL